MRRCLMGLASVGVVLLSGCSNLDGLLAARPAMSLQNVRFGDIDLQQATLLFDVEVQNPYGVALPLLDLSYALNSGPTPLLSGTASLQTTIPANQKQTVTLPVSMGYMDVVNAFKGLKDVRPGSTIPYGADLAISADTPVLGTLRVPLRTSGDLTVPTLQDAESWKTIFDTLDRLRSL